MFYGLDISRRAALPSAALPALLLALAPACGDDSGRDSDSASGGSDSATVSMSVGASESNASASESGASATGTAGGDSDSASTTADTSATSTGSDSTTDDSAGSTSDPLFPDLPAPEDMPEEMGCGGGDGPGEMVESFIWISNTAVGTVSKINTKTGVIEGRYNTAAVANSPSRTTVNQFGDTLVGNRGENASITVFASDPERCVDYNMDGVITTSQGTDDVLPWGEDECMLWHVDVPAVYSHGPRAVAWEGGELDPDTCLPTVPEPRVWVAFRGGGNTTSEVWRLHGMTGEILDQVSIPEANGRPYGGAVNKEGDFWFSTRGSPAKLIHVDAETLEATVHNAPQTSYGMAIDQYGNPWVAAYQSGANADQVFRFDIETEEFVSAGGLGGYHRGMTVDELDRAWVVGNQPCRLALFDAKNDILINDTITLPGCSNPVGTSIDVDGYVWVVDQGASLAYKIDPDTYAVELTVENLYNPYTYSDMTGGLLTLVLGVPE